MHIPLVCAGWPTFTQLSITLAARLSRLKSRSQTSGMGTRPGIASARELGWGVSSWLGNVHSVKKILELEVQNSYSYGRNCYISRTGQKWTVWKTVFLPWLSEKVHPQSTRPLLCGKWGDWRGGRSKGLVSSEAWGQIVGALLMGVVCVQQIKQWLTCGIGRVVRSVWLLSSGVCHMTAWITVGLLQQ